MRLTLWNRKLLRYHRMFPSDYPDAHDDGISSKVFFAFVFYKWVNLMLIFQSVAHHKGRMGKPFDLNRFESLGDNCEFGFFMIQAGVDVSSYFRWVAVDDYKKILIFFRERFANPFNLYYLEPLQDWMVKDRRYGIGYHSEMHSGIINGKRDFLVTQERKKTVYLHELNKIKYLKAKLIKTLKEEEKIFVVKKHLNEQGKEIKLIAKEINKIGSCKVLRVISTQNNKLIGKVKKVNKYLFYGYIDRFADYNKANEVSFDCWMSILKEASRKM